MLGAFHFLQVSGQGTSAHGRPRGRLDTDDTMSWLQNQSGAAGELPIERREGPRFPLEIAGCRTAGRTHLKNGVEVSDKPYASTSSRRFELRDEFIGLTRHNLRAQKELRWRAVQYEGFLG